MNLTGLPSYPYITGDSFRGICGWVLDEYGWRRQAGLQDFVFVKTDFLRIFRMKHLPKQPFKLITHNSDYGINADEITLDILACSSLKTWYAQNVIHKDPRLIPIPIGLTNRRNPHYSDQRVITKTRNTGLVRHNLVYANYNCKTNPRERDYCANQTGVPPVSGLDFESYLRDLCEHFFVISPNGNGIDCHRTWESLYCMATPIVTPYTLFETLKLPVLVIKDWKDYKDLQLCNGLHNSLWEGFDSRILYIDGYLHHLGII